MIKGYALVRTMCLIAGIGGAGCAVSVTTPSLDSGSASSLDSGSEPVSDVGVRRDVGQPTDAARADAAAFDSGALRRCERTADCPPGTSCSIFGQCIPSAPADAGVRADASSAPDGGEVSDADAGLDAGQRPDAQAPDAGGLRPGDDHGDSLAEASDLGALGVQSIGRGSRGEIDISGDEDFFVFQAERAGTYFISTRGSTDTFCHLLRSDGTELARNDDGGSGFNCAIEFVLEPGAYGIRVRHWSRGTGAYTLDVRFSPGAPEPQCGNRRIEAGEECDDGNQRSGDGCSAQCRREPPPNPRDDHSNTADGATEIGVGERRNGRLEVQGDVDFFVVRSDQAVRVIAGTIGETNTRCVAESVAGDVLDDDEDSGAGTNCRVRFDLAPGRPVYLRVQGQEPIIAGVYQVFIALE